MISRDHDSDHNIEPTVAVAATTNAINSIAKPRVQDKKKVVSLLSMPLEKWELRLTWDDNIVISFPNQSKHQILSGCG